MPLLQNLELTGGFPDEEQDWGTAMNTNLRKLSALVQPHFKDKDLNAPPGSPSAGDIYIVGPTPSGAWTGENESLALYTGTAWEFYLPQEGWIGWLDDENMYYRFNSGSWAPLLDHYYDRQVACSDLTSVITTGLAASFRMPCAGTLLELRAALDVEQTGGTTFTIDVEKNGTTVLSTLLTIDNTEETSETATPSVISVPAFADDDKVQVYVTQVGDGTARGLTVSFRFRRTA